MIPVQYLIALRTGQPDSSIRAAGATSPLSPAQQRTMAQLRHAALGIFEKKGYDDATAEDVAQCAGVSRRTFFRYFPAKTDALFSDHAAHLARLDELLGDPRPDRLDCAGHALGTVLDEYLVDAEFIRRRASLVASFPALRDRELLWTEEYQRRLGAYLASGSTTELSAIWAEITASAMLTAFRNVLARASTGNLAGDPRPVLDRLTREIATRITEVDPRARFKPGLTTVVTTTLPPETVAQLLQAAEADRGDVVGDGDPPAPTRRSSSRTRPGSGAKY